MNENLFINFLSMLFELQPAAVKDEFGSFTETNMRSRVVKRGISSTDLTKDVPQGNKSQLINRLHQLKVIQMKLEFLITWYSFVTESDPFVTFVKEALLNAVSLKPTNLNI